MLNFCSVKSILMTSNYSINVMYYETFSKIRFRDKVKVVSPTKVLGK